MTLKNENKYKGQPGFMRSDKIDQEKFEDFLSQIKNTFKDLRKKNYHRKNHQRKNNQEK